MTAPYLLFREIKLLTLTDNYTRKHEGEKPCDFADILTVWWYN
jgi:hypothetical protein